MTRKITAILISLAALSGLLLMPAAAAADSGLTQACTTYGAGSQSDFCQGSSNPSNNPISGSNGILLKIVQIIGIIAGTAAVIIIIVAGISFITAGGEPAKVERARSALIGAIAGLIVIALAESIVSLVLSKIQ